VLADLDGRIDAILDAGSSPVGVESTVLDPTTDPVIVYRPGGVTAEQIGQLLGGVRVAERKPVAGSPDDGSEDVASEAAREGQESPGLSLRHYAPRARLVLVATQAELVEVLLRETSFNEDQGQGVRVGVLLPGGWTLPADWPIKTGAATVTIVPWGSWSQPELLARELYGQMRALDEQGVDLIVCPMPAAEGIGLAIRDRLLKAAQ
jgi:L-threonylcarbamoyladenylate synthase